MTHDMHNFPSLKELEQDAALHPDHAADIPLRKTSERGVNAVDRMVQIKVDAAVAAETARMQAVVDFEIQRERENGNRLLKELRERCAVIAESFINDCPEGLSNPGCAGWDLAAESIAARIREGK